MMKEPYASRMVDKALSVLQTNIPQMISFMDSPIDQQPWEKSGNAVSISPSETEISLLPMVRDVLSHASVPALMGQAFMDNNPFILEDLYEMDRGLPWLLSGLPGWLPFPPLVKAHIARNRVQDAMNRFHRALDKTVDGESVEAAWANMEDVCDLMMKRHQIYRGWYSRPDTRIPTNEVAEHEFKPEERADITVRSRGVFPQADLS